MAQAKKRTQPAVAKPGNADEAQRAWQRIEPLVMALDPAELRPIRVDIGMAVSRVLGALVAVEELSDELKRFPEAVEAKAMLKETALGALYAQLHCIGGKAVDDSELNAMLEEATPLRERLLLAAETLAHFGLVDAEAVRVIRAGQGNVDKAADCVALSALFRGDWEALKDKSPVTLEEVDRASVLGPKLLLALGMRDAGVLSSTEAAAWVDRRNRAYTLLLKQYQELERAVTWIRWHEGDAPAWVPSLFARRRRGRSQDDADATEEAEPVTSPAEISA